MGEIARWMGWWACLLHVGEVWLPEFWQKLVSTQNLREINEISKKEQQNSSRFDSTDEKNRHTARKAF